MSENIYSVAEMSTMLLPVFDQYKVKKAILFGSFSKGNATSKSDVDLLDITHINFGLPIEQEIARTGVVIYEK